MGEGLPGTVGRHPHARMQSSAGGPPHRIGASGPNRPDHCLKEEEQRRRTDDGQGASTGYVGRSARWMVASAREETPVCVLVIGDRWIPAAYVDALTEVCGPFRTGG